MSRQVHFVCGTCCDYSSCYLRTQVAPLLVAHGVECCVDDGELCNHFGIYQHPTILFLKHGKLVATISGKHMTESILQKLTDLKWIQVA
jgi:hypothetical protein